MTRRLRLVMVGLTILVALLLVTVVACGDDGGEAAVTPTPVDAQLKDQLRQMALPLENLPSGVILAEEFFVTAEQSAAESDDREGRLARLQEWGYILGYEVTYQANPEVMSQTGLILTNSSASLYESEEGAIASFADAVDTARTTDWAAVWGGAQEVEWEERPSPKWVDDMLWLHIKATAETEEGEEETFANDFVLFRQGPGRAALIVGWVTGRGSADIVVQLAQAQAERLENAIP